MGQQVTYFAGVDGDAELIGAIRGLGLHVVSGRSADLEPARDPSIYPSCYISRQPRETLHPRGHAAVFLDVVDPIIELTRAYFAPPCLVAGRVYWNDDSEVLAAQTKNDFRRVAQWIRRNWQKRRDGFYQAPDAAALLAKGGAQVAYLAPAVGLRVLGT